MKNGTKRLIALLLIAVMLVPYAGCGKKGETISFNKNAIYKEEKLSLDLPKEEEISELAGLGNKLFITTYTTNEETYESKINSYIANLDGTEITPFKLSDDNGQSYISTRVPYGDDKLLFMAYEDKSDYSDPDNPVYDGEYTIKIADYSGNVITKKPMSEMDFEYVDGIKALPDGRILMYQEKTLYLLDKDLNLVKKEEVSGVNWLNQIFADKSGKLYVQGYGETGAVVKELDVENLKLTNEPTVPPQMTNMSICGQGGQYDVYLSSGSSIYAFNVGDTELTEVFNLIDSDIAAQYFETFIALADGSFIGTYHDWDAENTEDTFNFCKYTKVDPKDVVEKEQISLGCLYLDGTIRKEVIKFNKTNEKCRIVVKDYSVYNTDEDYAAGQKKMNSDIAAGQSPDIVIAQDAGTMINYASKGLFVDLYQYIDSDPDINREDMFDNVLKAGEVDGKLTFVSPTFFIQTLVGKKSILGDRKSWTFNELKEFESTLPQGSQLMFATAREDFMSQCMMIDAKSYIDYSTHSCNFDTDEFKALLSFVKELPKGGDDYYRDLEEEYSNIDWESMYRDDKFILSQMYLANIENYKYQISSTYGEDIAFVGYPTGSGCGSAFGVSNPIAISSKCKTPEIAWEFVRVYFSDDYMKNQWGLPIIKSNFDKQLEDAQKEHVEEEDDYAIYGKDVVYYGDQEYKPLTKQQADDLKSFVMSVTTFAGNYEEEVFNIINEEAAPFFEGQKSVDEVTPIIQSRISIYLKEKQ